MFKVLRHGGNSNHDWRIVLETNDKNKAIKMYNKLYRDMRQGGVVLMKDEEIIKNGVAPRVRSIW